MVYDSTYLSHHGILGQKWGDKNGPPYPLKKSAYSSAEKSARKSTISRINSAINTRNKRREEERVKKAEEKKQAEEKSKQEEREQLKQSVMKSRSPAMIYKHADLFTTDELNQLSNRLSAENKIKNLDTTFVEKGKKFIATADTIGTSLGKAAIVVENGIKIYDNVAKVMNTFYGTDMKIVNNNDQNKKKNKKQKSEDKN